MVKNILWFCNRPIDETSDRRDGTWFTAMARALVDSKSICLAVVSQAKVRHVTRRDYYKIPQWVVPYEHLGQHGLPSRRTIEGIQKVVSVVNPDLIHVWGTENYWGLLTARGLLKGPVVLEMQGIKYIWAKVFYGDLSAVDRMRCVGPLEIIKPTSHLFFGRRRFERWGRYEKEMIIKHKYISTQSDWVRMHVSAVNPECRLFSTRMMLRKEFYEATPWAPVECRDKAAPRVFAMSSGPFAYKGLHILMKAVAILKKNHPRIRLYIGGDILKRSIRRSGYARWLLGESRRLAINDDICWLGPLDAGGIVHQLQQASTVVVPSFVESYSLVLAEAMILGVPAVASNVGAMPELAHNGEAALLFTPGDAVVCAQKMRRIFNDPSLAHRLSKKARQIGLDRNDPKKVINTQIGIYRRIKASEK